MSYDPLGQIVAGIKYWPDGTPVAGQQFDYVFDSIGNRTQTKTGGDQNGANLRSANYSADNLNRYSSRDIPGAVDVMGLGFATNAVTVNGQTAYRKGEYFRKEIPVSNGSVPVWQSITNAATGQASITGNVFVPKTPELFYYDADGNLTNDGCWRYAWDAENRLVTLTTNTAVGPRQSLKFEYDWRGRRIRKQVWPNASWNGTPTNDVKFVYDGWNLLAELNATNNAVIRSFMWGSDLSGTSQGAGGVGGLLVVVYKGEQTTNCFVAFDGNGNVAALADAGSTNILAQYEYGPFGEVIRATGPMAKANPFRFSTKYQDDETDLVYYGYRYYSANTGRWLSRDPIEEKGGINLYAFVENAPTMQVDTDGRWVVLGGGWDMFWYLLGGNLGANVTISDLLIQSAKANLDNLKRGRLLLDLRKTAKCGQSGSTRFHYNDNNFSIEPGEVSFFGMMGNWQMVLQGNCAWRCGQSKTSDSCCCDCSANCRLTVSLSKTYTFNVGYNPYNDRLLIRLLDWWAWLGQRTWQWNAQQAYMITARFDDSYAPDFKPMCRGKR